MATALALQKKKDFDVTVVDPRDAFYFVIAFPRALVDGSVHRRMLFSYADMLKGTSITHVRQRATAIDAAANEVTTADGAKLAYDYLVVGTGSQNAGALKTHALAGSSDALLAALGALTQRVKAARRVVIVGGGAVGLESAGEIASAQPLTEVVVVHSGPRLLEPLPNGAPAIPNKFYAKLGALCVLCAQRALPAQRLTAALRVATDEKLKELPNIRVVLNDRVQPDAAAAADAKPSSKKSKKSKSKRNDDDDDGAGDDGDGDNNNAEQQAPTTVRLQSGATIADVDLVLWCVGADIKSAPLLDAFERTAFGLKVDPTLQLRGHRNIFARERASRGGVDARLSAHRRGGGAPAVRAASRRRCRHARRAEDRLLGRRTRQGRRGQHSSAGGRQGGDQVVQAGQLGHHLDSAWFVRAYQCVAVCVCVCLCACVFVCFADACFAAQASITACR